MITRTQVLEAIKTAVERTPEATNPRGDDGDSCLNTGPDGSHRIAAQVLVDLGYPVTDHGGGYNNWSIVETLSMLDITDFKQEAVDTLDSVQKHFDGTYQSWSDAYDSWED